MTAAPSDWSTKNQRHLMSALRDVRSALERHAGISADRSRGREADESSDGASMPALEVLCRTFGLSTFERAILLLCAGMELDAGFAAICAKAQGEASRAYPTFSLALAALPEPHWSALTPAGALRRWRLVETTGATAGLLTSSPLRIDERILHYLAGIDTIDERLAGLLDPVAGSDGLVPSHQEVARQAATAWSGVAWNATDAPLPVIQLAAGDEVSRRSIARAACAEIGLRLYALAAEAVPSNPADLEGLIRLWEREAALKLGALYIDAERANSSDAHAMATISRIAERTQGAVFLSVREVWRPLRRPVLTLEVRKPTPAEQKSVWSEALGATVPDAGIESLTGQFNLSVSAIRSSAMAGISAASAGGELTRSVWDASRSQARPHLDDLAQRIEPSAGWDDLVLPDEQQRQLREIATHVAHRAKVYDTWGFGTASRGLGISALFAGASGTGKTMAAEVLAGELRLDLYRIDLSGVVSKYIGETEKNLRRVFDAAEDGGAVLFFDEADALFGKRSEVKDSHDRYANIEISYLLQRMEVYRGLAVLATNMKSALDTAFLRRIRFVVNFPFPDEAHRAEMWRRAFPARTPVDRLDIGRLARLNLAGGNIRNIALGAAFLAAGAGEPVCMSHLRRAARGEYAKLERPHSELDAEGWG